MARRRKIRRMMRQRLTCSDLKRQCEMRTEYRTIYNSPDGKVFRIQRQGCPNCGRRHVSAMDVSVVVPRTPWCAEDDGDDSLEVYKNGELWEGC